MKIPVKIRVGANMWEVKHTKGDPENDGKVDFIKKIVYIDDDLSQEYLASTLLHEVLHIGLHQSRVKMEEQLEEQVVWSLEHILCGFAKDHQKLFIDMVKEMGK